MTSSDRGDFIHRANIERFTQLLARTNDEDQRRQLHKLIAEEKGKRLLIGSEDPR